MRRGRARDKQGKGWRGRENGKQREGERGRESGKQREVVRGTNKEIEGVGQARRARKWAGKDNKRVRLTSREGEEQVRKRCRRAGKERDGEG